MTLQHPSARFSSRRLMAALTLCCLALSTATAQESVSPRTALEGGLRLAVEFAGEDAKYSIPDRMRHYKVPGLSVAIIDDWEVRWSAGYGSSEATDGKPVTERTLFQAASISKAFVAVAALRMRDAGLIDLDVDVQRYVRDYELPLGKQTPENPVTFRNLLSHTSGITPGGYAGYVRGEPFPTDLEILRGEPPANSRAVSIIAIPGTEVAYSGGGYTLIELALQNVASEPFEALMEQWVLAPLDLSRSTFEQPIRSELESEVAAGHASNGERVPGGWRIHPEQAAAGMWSTAANIAILAAEVAKAHQGRSELLSQETARELLTEQLAGEAVGVVINGEGEAFAFSHAGGNVGYRAFMIMHPATGDGAVWMANSDSGAALGDEILRAASAVHDWPDYKPRIATRHVVDSAKLEGLVGGYRFDARGRPAILEVLFESPEADFAIKFPNGDVYPLTPVGPRNFVHVDTGVTVDFEGADGQETLIVYGTRAERVRN